MIEGASVGFAAAFAAGVVSFLSPCVLPLVPAYVSYVAGQPLLPETAGGTGGRARMSLLGAFFVLGFSTVFVALGAILTVSAVQTTVSGGIALLAFYAAGLGVPFLLAALFMRELAGRLWALRRAGRALQAGAGVVMVAMGVAMATGQLTALSYWMLRVFPVLGRIG